MYSKKIILILLLLIVIKFLTTNNDFFQEKIKLLVDESNYPTINLDSAKIKMNPDFNSDNFNINIQNDLIVENKLKVHEKDLTIKRLRYLKKLPIHYEDEICLTDAKGKECIKKEHIDIIKGNLPIKLITYPDNYRRCLSSYIKTIKSDWFMGPEQYYTYTAQNCKNGNPNQEFYIQRNNNYDNHGDESHYHRHSMDKEYHYFRTLPASVMYNEVGFDPSVFGNITISVSDLRNYGFTDEQIAAINPVTDQVISASDLAAIAGSTNTTGDDGDNHGEAINDITGETRHVNS